MPKIDRSERFQKAQAKLPDEIFKKLKKTLQLLATNPRHPSLQSKQLEGTKGIYEARVDQNYRLTYQRQPGDILRLRTVGRHDETLRNP